MHKRPLRPSLSPPFAHIRFQSSLGNQSLLVRLGRSVIHSLSNLPSSLCTFPISLLEEEEEEKRQVKEPFLFLPPFSLSSPCHCGVITTSKCIDCLKEGEELDSFFSFSATLVLYSARFD